MIPITSTYYQIYAQSYLRLHLHITDQTTPQRKIGTALSLLLF